MKKFLALLLILSLSYLTTKTDIELAAQWESQIGRDIFKFKEPRAFAAFPAKQKDAVWRMGVKVLEESNENCTIQWSIWLESQDGKRTEFPSQVVTLKWGLPTDYTFQTTDGPITLKLVVQPSFLTQLFGAAALATQQLQQQPKTAPAT